MTKKLIILILILSLGAFLRIWKVDEIPPGVNRDEAAIGYTAYSILKTGRDEYGTFFPLSIKSFGDWKLPFYIYLDIIPVKLFSLNEFTVRIPSVFLGTLTIFVFYFLILELIQKQKQRQMIALVGAFLLSISPWQIHFSRVASEANVALFLVTLGIYLFLKGFYKPFLFVFSSIFLSLSLYTYHGNHIFSTLLFFILIGFLISRRRDKKSFLFFIVPFCILALVIFGRTLFSADKTKISGLLTTSDIYLVYDKVDLARLEHGNASSIIAKVFHNKIALFWENFITNFIKSFSPEFLFIKGGGNLQHNIPDFGNLYIWESIFIILGIYFIFARRNPWRFFLLSWLLIAPVASAITRDAPHSARMLSLLPLPHLFSAIGLVEILSLIKYKRVINMFILIIIILLALNQSVYLDRYFVHFPIKSEYAWGGLYKKLVSEIKLLENNYVEVLMDRPDYSPYIYFLFYNQIDPKTFQTEVVRYPEDKEGFQHVKAFKNMTFKKLDWSDDLLKPDRLLISWVDSTPINATSSSLLVDEVVLERVRKNYGETFGLEIGDVLQNSLIKKVRLENGQPQFYLIEIRHEKYLFP